MGDKTGIARVSRLKSSVSSEEMGKRDGGLGKCRVRSEKCEAKRQKRDEQWIRVPEGGFRLYERESMTDLGTRKGSVAKVAFSK
jgi:hypothetical protein